jgi:protein-S-isoprenylcysteine O-methyltransferase Ste14
MKATARTEVHTAASGQEPPDRPDVIALPPLVYAVGLVVGFLMELAVPVPGLPRSVSWSLGLTFFVAGAALGLWFLHSFHTAKTAVDVRRPTTTIVTHGPFRFSRNPGYLSLTGMYVGLAVLAGALWPLFLLPVVLYAIHRGVIEREERYLEGKFGDEYRRYREATRRWL